MGSKKYIHEKRMTIQKINPFYLYGDIFVVLQELDVKHFPIG